MVRVVRPMYPSGNDIEFHPHWLATERIEPAAFRPEWLL